MIIDDLYPKIREEKGDLSNVVIGTREIGRDWRMVVDTKGPVKDDRPMTAEAANK